MMPEYTANYNLIKPGYDETADIKVINENMDTLDTAIKAVEDKTANAPDNSVSDNAIGERTPNASLVPTSPGTGKLGQVLSWVTNRIKAITGKANWWDNPAKSLQQLADDHAAHLADNVSKVVLVAEPYDQETQTTVYLGFKPKNVTILAVILYTEYESIGFSDGTSQFNKYKYVSNGTSSITSNAILFRYNDLNSITGNVVFTESGLLINWTKAGTLSGVSGNRRLLISAITHGEG